MTDIEKLKELEAKATSGKWQVGFNDGSGLGEYDTGYSIIAPEVAEDETVVFSGDNDGCLLGIRKKEDAEFIVAAKNALPAIFASLASKDAEIERLKAERNETRELYDECAIARDTVGYLGTVVDCIVETDARAEAAESRLTTALAALGEAKSGLVEIEAITPHKATRLCARAALAKLNEIERNADG